MFPAHRFAALVFGCSLVVPVLAADADLTGYKTLDKAVVAPAGQFKAAPELRPDPAYLGSH